MIEAGSGTVDQLASGEPDGTGLPGDQVVCGGAVQMHGGQQRLLRWPALGEQCGDQASEHVAAARRGQAGVAGSIDEPGAVGRRDDRATSLQGDVGAESLGQFAGGGNAVVLDVAGVALQKSGGFGWMGGE